MNDKEIESLERVANALRGMAMDHRIPSEVRDVITASAGVIDAITEIHLDAQPQTPREIQ
ncbi:hypothetical protein [Epibacterium sp. Ofav1-8]|uniref:hypothetical protein n=1 Tax=Epibacterium sp. Ofav1-8 TaxID=2917735 RepID=UPI001EF67560|nr:hypothetical protein [Epibacterium sp. Ofav1-8]MCG7625572.1 hypothetical protein [Epibacterium sp. Ofav1-8]